MKRFYLYLSAILISCAFSLSTFAQGQYMFNHMDTNQGLSCSSVLTMFVDSRGYLWVGTENGLNRFDGYSFKTYYTFGSNTRDLANNIQSIQEDAEGKIWIECFQPYVLYSGGKTGFTTNVEEYIKSLGIKLTDSNYKIHIDAAKNIYVITAGHIYYYDFKQKKVENWTVGLPMNTREGWTVDDVNEGLIITHENEIWKFDSRTGRLQKLALPDSFKDVDKRYRCYVDNDNTMWVYSTMSESIFRMNSDGSVHSALLLTSEFDSQSNSIRALLDDDLGNIWIATDHEGVFIYNKRTGETQNITSSVANSLNKNGAIASNNVTCIYKDRMGTIWLGHLKNGISYTNDYYQIFQNRAQQCGDISTLFTDSKGNLWLGTDGNGLYTQSPEGVIAKAPVPNITISSIAESNGDIYVGTYNEGIYCIGKGGALSHMSTADGTLPTNAAWRIVHDKKGKIWTFSAFGTLTSIDGNTGEVKSYTKDNGEDIIGLALIFDGKKTLYAGTFYGVWEMNTETGKGKLHLGNKSGKQDFLNTTVISIYKDEKNNALWLGHFTGITVWDMKNDSVHYIDRSSGLADNFIKSILKDEKGNIWVSTGAGISCIQPTYEDGFRTIVRNYSSKDGLPSTYFNGGAACNIKPSELAMGGPQGYTLIRTADTQSLALTSSKPIISQISIGDSVIVADPAFLSEEYSNAITSVDLEYGDRQIMVQYFTGNLLNATRVRYAYRLAGLSDEWSYTNDAFISFFSIPAGSYTLEIKACGEDGTWSEVTTLDINVAPPFYASVWAIIIYILLFAVLCFLTYRFLRERQFSKLAAQKASLENEQFDRMAKMKQQFFTNMSNELRTPLTLIISPLQTLVNQPIPADIKTRLQMILKNAQLLLHQVNMLLDFRHMESASANNMNLEEGNVVTYLHTIYSSFLDYAKDRKVQFLFSAQHDTVVLPYDSEKLYKVMYYLISNAFRFSPENSTVSISVRDDEKYLYVDIADSGTGISDEDKKLLFQRFAQSSSVRASEGGNVSLQIVQEYVKLHRGSVEVKDNNPKGAIFTFSLPKPATQETEKVVYVPLASVQQRNQSVAEPEKPAEVVETYDPREEVFKDALEIAELNRTIADDPTIDDDNVAEAVAQATDGKEEETEEQIEQNHRFTMLMVDDSYDMCRFVRDYFRGEYNIITASDGEQALKCLKENDGIDLVVSDVTMPKMDGLELCKVIKSDLRWSHIPVILLTGRTDEEYEVQGLKLGADDYITKPFNAEMLRLRVRKFIEKKENRQRQFKEKIDVAPSEITITSVDEKFIRKAIQICEDNIHDPNFSVESLGQELAMSRTYLYRKLMNITGKGPGEFIRIIRLKRGKQYLEQSQMQITEIAYAIGYSSPKRFTENFRQEFGITPSEYLKKYKAEHPE